MFLVVPHSSIGVPVTDFYTLMKKHTRRHGLTKKDKDKDKDIKRTPSKSYPRLLTFETFDQSDEET